MVPPLELWARCVACHLRAAFLSMYRLAPGLVLAATSCVVHAADISVFSSLSYWTINQSELAAGPGTDLAAQIDSGPAATLTISNTSGNPWGVFVSCTAPGLPASVTFKVRQTGGNYVDCTQTAAPFLCGSGDQSDIQVQYEIHGASVSTLQPGLAAFTVTYTLLSSCS